MINDLRESAVIGAGTMGRGIANVLASNGHRVAIVDSDMTVAEAAKDLKAFRCVEQGIAAAEDIDTIVRSSFGFRLGAFGPLQVSDLAGLDVYLGVYDYLADRCGDPWYEAPQLLRELVSEGRTGVKSLAGVYEYSSDEADRLRAERDRLLYRHLRMYRDDGAASPAEQTDIGAN